MMDFMKEIVNGFLETLLKLLPTSPFADFIDKLDKLPYLGYLNWFVPVGEMIVVATLWLTAIGLFYLYSVIARWVKLIS